MNKSRPSDRYAELITQYRHMHEHGKREAGIVAGNMFPGTALLPHIKKIRGYLNRYECKSAIDYGCGKAAIYHARDIALKDGSIISSIQEYWGINQLVLYDPGVIEYSMLPSVPCDALICTDVLEHCYEDDLKWILPQLFSLANKFIYANIASYPAEKTLPNGENAHVTIKQPSWWRNLIESAAGDSVVRYCFVVEEKKPRGMIRSFRLPFVKGVSRIFTNIERL